MWLFRSHLGTSHFYTVFSTCQTFNLSVRFMEAETGGMFTCFARRWLREMSCPETGQVRWGDSRQGQSDTFSLFLLLGYALYTQPRLADFLIYNCVSLAVWSEEGPVTGRYRLVVLSHCHCYRTREDVKGELLDPFIPVALIELGTICWMSEQAGSLTHLRAECLIEAPVSPRSELLPSPRVPVVSRSLRHHQDLPDQNLPDCFHLQILHHQAIQSYHRILVDHQLLLLRQDLLLLQILDDRLLLQILDDRLLLQLLQILDDLLLLQILDDHYSL